MTLGQTQKKEIKSIIFLGLALLIFLSLYSYNHNDPSYSNQPISESGVSNFIGLAGSWVADALFQTAGWSAYLIPFLLLFETIRTLRSTSDGEFAKYHLLGIVFLFFSVMIVCSLKIKNPPEYNFKPGGFIGDAVSTPLINYFQVSGTYILTAILFCLSIVLSTQFLFTRFLNGVGQLIAALVTYPKTRRTRKRGVAVSKPKKKLITPSPVKQNLPRTAEKKTRSDEAGLPLFSGKKVAVPDGAPYHLPPLALLTLPPKTENTRQHQDEINATAERLEKVLNQFGVKAEVVGFSRGPVITRYELEPASGVKVSRIVGLSDDLALRLEAKTIRIIAPIPGKAAVGIELPNESVQIVTLGELLVHPSHRQGDERLRLGLGKTISGEIYWADLEKMPHLLVAGATGAGKSVCINTIIANILYNASPDEVKFLLIDPKRVELNIFEELPHLLVPVVVEVEEASIALKWVVREMESRYQNFARLGIRNIQGYNRCDFSRKLELSLDEHLPYIVVIIDEFADLMMLAGKEVETSITRLAQMARAVGIHLILATQRPSVDVITGLIKANFPARIAFKVASKIDSRTILDGNGAEKLLGEGDMLFSPSGASKPVRVQGPYISREELVEITDFIKQQQAPDYAMDILQPLGSKFEEEMDGGGLHDEYYSDAVRIVIEEQVASSSRLQRRLKIGYNRAARLIEEMEANGIVGTLQSNNTRTVIKGPEYLQQLNYEE